MSPFLAEVNVINLAGDAKSSGTPGDYADAVAELRANLQQIQAKAKAEIATATEKARRETVAQTKEDADKDDDDTGDKKVTVTADGKTVVVHHSKSKNSDGDMFVAAVPIVAIVFTFLWLIVRALMAPFTNRYKRGGQGPVVMEGLSADEAALLEKLQRTLAQMESRVESLETILIDPARTKEKYGTKL